MAEIVRDHLKKSAQSADNEERTDNETAFHGLASFF